MARMFVALTPPAAIRSSLLSAMGGIAGARWQDDGQLHLTLAFLDHVPDTVHADLDTALRGIHHSAFDFWCEGVGLFDKNDMINAVWAGGKPHDTLTALATKTQHAARRTGIAIEHREFVPHVTLARLNRSTGPIDHWITDQALLRTPVARITRIGLFESTLHPEGARYTLLESYPLHD